MGGPERSTFVALACGWWSRGFQSTHCFRKKICSLPYALPPPECVANQHQKSHAFCQTSNKNINVLNVITFRILMGMVAFRVKVYSSPPYPYMTPDPLRGHVREKGHIKCISFKGKKCRRNIRLRGGGIFRKRAEQVRYLINEIWLEIQLLGLSGELSLFSFCFSFFEIQLLRGLSLSLLGL